VQGTGLFCESDGTFPNHHPDPTVPANLQDLIAAVKRDGAELGIAFDGDADRIGLVDGDGRIIWGDHILILYARDVLERTGRGQPIIFDVKCSQALPHEIEKAGGRPVMWKTGHSLIKDKMKELKAPLAGEMSGHMFFADRWFGFDDAVYAGLRLVELLTHAPQTLAEIAATLPALHNTPEIRMPCPDEIKFEVVKRAVAWFRARYNVVDVDGARVIFQDAGRNVGWGLVRASNTGPVLVMRFEADSAQRLGDIQSLVEGRLKQIIRDVGDLEQTRVPV
jgi:phosphomannomutase/phosphoglucomutase